MTNWQSSASGRPKPEEFKAYDDYCEACKANVKQKLGIV